MLIVIIGLAAVHVHTGSTLVATGPGADPVSACWHASYPRVRLGCQGTRAIWLACHHTGHLGNSSRHCEDNCLLLFVTRLGMTVLYRLLKFESQYTDPKV